MNVTNDLLFGIAVLLFGGFVTVAEAAAVTGTPFDSFGYTVVVAGLGMCILGPVAERTVSDSRSD